MAPGRWQASRGVHAEEVAARGLPKAVEMFVRSDERRLTLQVNAGFFSYLPDRCLDRRNEMPRLAALWSVTGPAPRI